MVDTIRKSLKVKLFLLFFTMNLSVIIMVGFISYKSKKEALQEQLERNLSVTAVELADKVDRYLSERTNDTKAIALHYSLFNLKSTTSSQNRVLSQYLKIYPYYEHINIINIEDMRTPEKNGGRVGMEDPSWYLPAINGEVVSSDMHTSRLTEKPAMAFAAPVRGADGKVVSVITANLNLNYLWDIVDQVRKEKEKSGLTGYAFIINGNGMIIAHPKTQKILHENALNEPDLKLRTMISEMVKGKSGTSSYTYEGIHKFAAYAPCKGYGNYPGHGWSLGVTYPSAELFLPMKSLLHNYIWIFLFTSIAAFAVSTYLANYIVRPILALKSGASRIGAGNFGMRIEQKTDDEIGELAGSFNNMAETLETRDKQLKDYTWTLTRINRELGLKQEELSKSNEVLKRTNEELKKLEKQKAEFTAMITHDIKSPLATVITYSEMVLNGTISCGGEDLRKAMGSIHASGYKILSLVDNFLVSSAIEAGRLQLNIKPLDINEFIEDELPFFLPQMEKKSITFTYNRPDGLPKVMADKMQLDRALSNIVTNAIKFTPTKGAISIKAAAEEGYMKVSVSDTGSGIAPEELEGIFNKYRRAKNSSKIEGIGLGLYISKAVIEAHGGRITVDSRPGEGSTFTLCLPLNG